MAAGLTRHLEKQDTSSLSHPLTPAVKRNEVETLTRTAEWLQEVEEEARSMGPDALLKQKIKQKRFRDGYAEGISTMHKQTSAAAFIASEQPVEMLGQYTRSADRLSHSCVD